MTEIPTPCPPLTDSQWPAELADLQGSFATQLNVYRVMAHNPELMRAWVNLRTHIVTKTALGAERSELVILRAGFRLGSTYEWSQHVHRAKAIGMSEERIMSMKLETPPGEDGLIAEAVDRLLQHHHLSPDFEAKLAEAIGRKAVIDLIATVGFYSVLGYLLLTYRTPLDDNIPEAPL